MPEEASPEEASPEEAADENKAPAQSAKLAKGPPEDSAKAPAQSATMAKTPAKASSRPSNRFEQPFGQTAAPVLWATSARHRARRSSNRAN